MRANGFDNDAAMAYFVRRVAAGPQLSTALQTLVYWEEVFHSAGAQLPAHSVVQAWKSNAMPAALRAGYRVTNSFKWCKRPPRAPEPRSHHAGAGACRAAHTQQHSVILWCQPRFNRL